MRAIWERDVLAEEEMWQPKLHPNTNLLASVAILVSTSRYYWMAPIVKMRQLADIVKKNVSCVATLFCSGELECGPRQRGLCMCGPASRLCSPECVPRLAAPGGRAVRRAPNTRLQSAKPRAALASKHAPGLYGRRLALVHTERRVSALLRAGRASHFSPWEPIISNCFRNVPWDPQNNTRKAVKFSGRRAYG